MRRVISLWFPHWPTDRLRRQRLKQQADATPVAEPLVTVVHDGRRRVIGAVDRAAARLGLRPGMPMAHALAMVPRLAVAAAEPEADAHALRRLALWCQRTTPVTAVSPPDGLWLEVAGVAHLFGGEDALLEEMVGRLGRDGLHARGAVADTPGAAHALARHGEQTTTVVAPGAQAAAMARLPVACLRLGDEMAATLHRLGFERVEDLLGIDRALLARRFGPGAALQLDQAQGLVHEPLVPVVAEHQLHRRETFLEPLLTVEALTMATRFLVELLCDEMECAGLGARRLDLVFERVDHRSVVLSVGTVRPSRQAGHLVRLLTERLDTLDPGLGIEAMQLIVPRADPLQWEQQESGGSHEVARLVDRLSNRLGAARVYRAAPVQSALPERLVRPRSALQTAADAPEPVALPRLAPAAPPRKAELVLRLVSSTDVPDSPARPDMPAQNQRTPGLKLVADRQNRGDGSLQVVPPWTRSRMPRASSSSQLSGTWPSRLVPPSRLLDPPRPVKAIASLPNEAPAAFTWRRTHRVLRSDGPERVYETWWDGGYESNAIRDYFQVEVLDGQRFWLFRRGNGLDLRTGDLTWFLHGVF